MKLSYHKMGMAGAHTRYLEREGAGLEQSTAHAHSEYLTREHGGLDHGRGQAFDLHTGQPVDAAAMVDRWSREHDAYHFRGVLAGERTPENMTEMLQEVIAKAEIHCGTRLQGFAVHHHGNGNPHTHFVMRGRHESGKSLYIDPQYIKEGFRHSAQTYLTRQFGERSPQEIERGLERSHEIAQEREQGIERVREHAQTYGLEDKDRASLERTMQKGSMKEIEGVHRRLDALERVREVEQEIGQTRAQELERQALDGSTRQVRQVERQVEQVQAQQAAERVQEISRGRSRGHDMDMGL